MHRPLASPSTRVLVSNEQRKCDCSWSPENVGVGAFAPPGKPRDARDDDPPVRARKPSNTSLIYEARTRRVFPMTTAYDVPPVLLIERLKERLEAEGKIKPPEWAPFARTGVHTEKAPVQKDWWYRRVAAVLRKVYLHGPVGTSRLAAEFGGRRDDGSAPYHPRRGSRSVAREAMQQLEAMGLLTKTDKKGRSISAQGRKLLDSLAHEILMDLAKTNPELTKYAGGP